MAWSAVRLSECRGDWWECGAPRSKDHQALRKNGAPPGLDALYGCGVPRRSRWWSAERVGRADAVKAIRNHRHVSHQKAREELGYSPRPIRETIADTVGWFKRSEML